MCSSGQVYALDEEEEELLNGGEKEWRRRRGRGDRDECVMGAYA